RPDARLRLGRLRRRCRRGTARPVRPPGRSDRRARHARHRMDARRSCADDRRHRACLQGRIASVPGRVVGRMSEEKGSWLSRLRGGLVKSTKRATESITGLFTRKKLDQSTLGELEDALIQADLGVAVAARLVAKLGRERFGKEVTDEEVRAAFADDIAEILAPVAVPLAIDPARKPHVVLVIGVNGSGKTTTIAKMAHLFKGEGKKVMLAAGDTFRAAAVEQLKVWGDRAGVPVVSRQTGADAAGLAYEALEKAKAEGC